MLLVFIAVALFEVVFLWGIHEFFYHTVESALTTRLDYSIDYFTKYYSSMTLSDVILEDIDIFWNHTACQVQIFSPEGELLMDSIGVEGTKHIPSDVRTAISGKKGVSVESPFYTSSQVMSVSKLMQVDGKSFAVLRFITNLDSVNNTIASIAKTVIVVGVFTVIITFVIGYFLGDTIVKPLERLTSAAGRMAEGNLKVDFKIERQDEIGRLAEALKFMSEELQKKEEIKNDFISSVSHELRTPLTAIKGWAATLRDDPEDRKILSEGLEIIESESDRLTDMVEELLDFSRYVSGRMTLFREKADLLEIIKKVVREITPRAENFSVSLVVNSSNKLGLYSLDSARFRQVLINVLDNAIKFSNEGGIVEVIPKKNENFIEISVIDHGIGIPPEEISRVKEKFYKGKSQYSHNGLGLSIAEEIMKLHGGELEIFSEPEKGTIVRILLPLESKNAK